ncbi:putative disease resistance protein RGA4 [Elaeis guineensis]
MAHQLGEWFGSAVVGQLVSRADSYLQDRRERRAGVRENLEKLRGHLRKISDVVDLTHGRSIKNPRLEAWLIKLKNAAYDAEDVLDVFEYERLKEQVNSSFSHCIRKRLRTFASSFNFCDDSGKWLKEIVDGFDTIAAEASDYCCRWFESDGCSPAISDENEDDRTTTSTLRSEEEVYGREAVKRDAVRMLLDESDSSARNAPVISILGFGGVGKTTFAKYVLADEEIQTHFDLKVWVYVSDKFDKLEIMKQIITSISQIKPHKLVQVKNMDYLLSVLRENLIGKRFLLVLDDVWDTKWEALCDYLTYAEKGSKILVTAREEKSVDVRGRPVRKIFLEGLAYRDFWLFFEACAFGNERVSLFHWPELKLVGMEIAKKLKGNPLAAKTVGKLLSANIDHSYWTSILTSDLWKLEQGPNDIMPALRLSYRRLPAHLQRCFAYCSIFPKGYKFIKERLVHMWMAHGFIQTWDEHPKLEDIGESYFNDLLQRSFFIRGEHSNDELYYMHDLIHDLAHFVSMHDYLRIDSDRIGVISTTVRHLSIRTDRLDEVRKVPELEKLRTLRFVFTEGGPDYSQTLEDVLKKLKSIRVLDFSDCRLNKLPEIGHLIHLRYLDLSSNSFEMLPSSLTMLYHLQVLNLRNCKICSLPSDINKLIKLRHLKAESDVVSTIANIGKLTSLKELSLFEVDENRGNHIKELENMSHLGGQLHIKCLDVVKTREEANKAHLDEKYYLKGLQLEWASESDNVEEVLEGLQPPDNLKELTIKRYSGTRSPTWLGPRWLSDLTSIHLSYCERWNVLPPLGQLQHLKALHMEGLNAVTQIGHQLYGNDGIVFPSLEVLTFKFMSRWEVWLGVVEGRRSFPRLRKLSIASCPELKRLPVLSMFKNQRDNISPSTLLISDCPCITCLPGEMLHQLKILGVKRCPSLSVSPPGNEGEEVVLSLVRLCIEDTPLLKGWFLSKGLPSLLELHVHCYPQLISFSRDQEMWLEGLVSLQDLHIVKCIYLLSLPVGLPNISHLEKLWIENCPAIWSLRERLPTSLKQLCIRECSPLLNNRCKRMVGSDWDKIEHIPYITLDSETIQAPAAVPSC